MATGLSMRHASEAKRIGARRRAVCKKFGVYSASGNGGEYLVMPFAATGRSKPQVPHHAQAGRGWRQAMAGRPTRAIRLLYNEDALRNTKLRGQPVIITEGEPDYGPGAGRVRARSSAGLTGRPRSIPLDATARSTSRSTMPSSELFGTDNLGGERCRSSSRPTATRPARCCCTISRSGSAGRGASS
jgi:hypothetical protein